MTGCTSPGLPSRGIAYVVTRRIGCFPVHSKSPVDDARLRYACYQLDRVLMYVTLPIRFQPINETASNEGICAVR